MNAHRRTCATRGPARLGTRTHSRQGQASTLREAHAGVPPGMVMLHWQTCCARNAHKRITITTASSKLRFRRSRPRAQKMAATVQVLHERLNGHEAAAPTDAHVRMRGRVRRQMRTGRRAGRCAGGRARWMRMANEQGECVRRTCRRRTVPSLLDAACPAALGSQMVNGGGDGAGACVTAMRNSGNISGSLRGAEMHSAGRHPARCQIVLHAPMQVA